MLMIIITTTQPCQGTSGTTGCYGLGRASCRNAPHPESMPALWQAEHSDGWQATKKPTRQWPPRRLCIAAHVQGVTRCQCRGKRTQRNVLVDVCGPVDFESFQLRYARRIDVNTYACTDQSTSLLCAEITLAETAHLRSTSVTLAKLQWCLQTRRASPGTLPSSSWCSCSVKHSANRPSPSFTVLQKMSYAAEQAPVQAEPISFSTATSKYCA